MKIRMSLSLFISFVLSLILCAVPITCFAVEDVEINIITQPKSGTVAKDTDLTLTVLPDITDLNLDYFTYQWQSSTDGTSYWSDIPLIVSSTYKPDTETIGTMYYRVLVSYDDKSGNTGSITSNIAKITVALNPSYQLTLIDGIISGGTYNGLESGEFKATETVTVTAHTISGKIFVKWTSNPESHITSTSETYSFIMPGYELTLTAEYTDITYSLIVNSGSGSGDYKSGETAYIEAAIPEDKKFENWTAEPDTLGFPSTSANMQFFMPDYNLALTANYTIIEKYTLTVNGNALGDYEADSLVNIMSPEVEGKTFNNWTAEPDTPGFPSSSANLNFYMPAHALALTANYTDNTTITGITITPSSVDLTPGATQAFAHNVTGIGSPSPSVIWSIDTASVSAGHIISQNGVLTVASNAVPGSKITVTATSVENNKINSTVVVTIIDNTPIVTSVNVSPSYITLDRPSSTWFASTVYGTNNPSQEVNWSISNNFTHNTKISPNGYLTIGSNETSYYIYVTATSKVDPNFSDTATVRVNIRNNVEPPIFYTDLSSSITIYYGDSITLSTYADTETSSYISYQWYKDGSRMLGETNRTLTITNADYYDEAKYYCMSTNTYMGEKASVKSTVCTLTVRGSSSYNIINDSQENLKDDSGDYGNWRTLSTTLNIDGKNFSSENINTNKNSYEIKISDSNEGFATIPNRTLTNLENKNNSMVLSIKSSYGSYELPVNIINMSDEANEILNKYKLSKNEVDVKVTLTNETNDSNINNALSNQFSNAKLLGSAINFDVSLIKHSTGNELGKLTEFSQPIQRYISISKSDLPIYYGVFKLNEETKTYEFVPHKAVKIDGVNNISINVNSNSTYVVVENNVNFADVPYGKWYTEIVKSAAAKGIVYGMGSNIFSPEGTVTRAEFVQMVVTVLDLPETKETTIDYLDVNKNSWYYNSIMKAKSAGILDKFPSFFDPNLPITREEMAVILAAAVRRENTYIQTISSDLSIVFKDYGSISLNNINDVSYIYSLRIMQGVGGGYFDPKGLSTRAQAATVLINILQRLNKI